MIICFLAPANEPHTKRWCKWFLSRGHHIHVISFENDVIDGVEVHYINVGANGLSNDRQKLRYISGAFKIKAIVKKINPDVVSAHRASSYGFIAGLCGLRKVALSVWGSDVYDFPQKGLIQRKMVEFSLKRADEVISISKCMADETSKYTNKKIHSISWGVDMRIFHPDLRQVRKGDERFVVGTIKALSPKYGIDDIINAISLVVKEYPSIPIEVRIAGRGSHEEEYKKLAKDLGVSNFVKWLGYISPEDAAIEWANMDIGIIPSTLDSESFGVAAVEAQACGTCLIISDIPGLMESTNPGISSIVVHRKNPEEIKNAIIDLYNDPDKRVSMGKNGRDYVMENYELNKCFERVEELFLSMKA